MIRTTIATMAALILVSAPDALADDLTGRASIIDGDTLEIHGSHTAMGHRGSGKQSALPGR
jgi:hypothetical protein